MIITLATLRAALAPPTAPEWLEDIRGARNVFVRADDANVEPGQLYVMKSPGFIDEERYTVLVLCHSRRLEEVRQSVDEVRAPI